MVLQETKAETMTKIHSIKTNYHKNMSFIEMQTINATIMAYDEYLRNKRSKDLLKYLLKVINKYLGILLQNVDKYYLLYYVILFFFMIFCAYIFI